MEKVENILLEKGLKEFSSLWEFDPETSSWKYHQNILISILN